MEIISALLTKEVLQVLGPVLGIAFAIFYVYNKGKKSGSQEAIDSYESSKEEFEKNVKKAEQENMALEKEKSENIAKIKNISGKLVDLIGLFNKSTRSGKAASSKTRKK